MFIYCLCHYGGIMALKKIRVNGKSYSRMAIDVHQNAVVSIFSCLRCRHQWQGRKQGLPIKCPECESPLWNVPYKNARAGTENAAFRIKKKYSVALFIHQELGLKILKSLSALGNVSITQVFSPDLNIMVYCSIFGIPFYGTDHSYCRECDYIISAYPLLIQKDVLALAKRDAFNIHFSLLPRNRGKYSLSWAILEGDRYHGVSIHRIAEKFDTGEVFLQSKVLIGDKTAKDLYVWSVKAAHDLLISNFRNLVDGKIKPVKQNKQDATYHDSFSIDFQREKYIDGRYLTAWQLDRKLRAFYFPPGQKPYLLEKGKWVVWKPAIRR